MKGITFAVAAAFGSCVTLAAVTALRGPITTDYLIGSAGLLLVTFAVLVVAEFVSEETD